MSVREKTLLRDPLRIGIAGLGTVGAGVVRTLDGNREEISCRAGRTIEIVAVSARDRTRNRGVDISNYAWEDDPVALARRPDIDLYVELVGGEDGAARNSVEAAIASGKDVVTANKALLAIHGQGLAELAEDAGQVLRFEAAVAGGIPVVKALSEGLAADRIVRILGVMNGTCNYILTRMEHTGLSYQEIFGEAEALGFLEADPNLDVGGIDAGHKLALLSSIAFGSQVDFAGMELEGIQRISAHDIEQAGDMGYRIKLLGISKLSAKGLEQRMQPCLVPKSSPIGQIENATNIVVLEGESCGPVFLRGAGAGQGPTAVAVIGDIIDLARGRRMSTFGQPAASLKEIPPIRAATTVPYYLRLLLEDRPGVLAKVATALGDAGISINRMRQYGHEGEAAPVIIVTHKTSRKHLDRAIADIVGTGVSLTDPVAIRIEEV